MDVSVTDVFAVLSRTPGAMRALLEGLPETWLRAREGENTFSPRDVIGHLIEGEKTDWVPRIRIILTHGANKAFEPFDRFAFRETSRDKSTKDLLEEFASLRSANLSYVESLSLTKERLSLRGLHPELGPVTLGQLLATWAVHDLNHIGQAVRVMSRQYDAAVGPWKAYLGILKG